MSFPSVPLRSDPPGKLACVGKQRVGDAVGKRLETCLKSRVRLLGLEPRTYGLKVRCSTN